MHQCWVIVALFLASEDRCEVDVQGRRRKKSSLPKVNLSWRGHVALGARSTPCFTGFRDLETTPAIAVFPRTIYRILSRINKIIRILSRVRVNNFLHHEQNHASGASCEMYWESSSSIRAALYLTAMTESSDC